MLAFRLRSVLGRFWDAGFCLGSSAALVLLVGWTALASGTADGAPYVVIGTLMLVSALLSRGYIRVSRLDELLPLLPVSAISGILLVSNALRSLVAGELWWTTWVVLVAGLLALRATHLCMQRPPPLL